MVLASLAAALAASAVLSFLDAPARPHELSGAMVQLRPPGLLARRRSWSVAPVLRLLMGRRRRRPGVRIVGRGAVGPETDTMGG